MWKMERGHTLPCVAWSHAHCPAVLVVLGKVGDKENEVLRVFQAQHVQVPYNLQPPTP